MIEPLADSVKQAVRRSDPSKATIATDVPAWLTSTPQAVVEEQPSDRATPTSAKGPEGIAQTGQLHVRCRRVPVIKARRVNSALEDCGKR